MLGLALASNELASLTYTVTRLEFTAEPSTCQRFRLNAGRGVALRSEPMRAAWRQALRRTCETIMAWPSSIRPSTNNRNTGSTRAVSTTVVPRRGCCRRWRLVRMIMVGQCANAQLKRECLPTESSRPRQTQEKEVGKVWLSGFVPPAQRTESATTQSRHLKHRSQTAAASDKTSDEHSAIRSVFMTRDACAAGITATERMTRLRSGCCDSSTRVDLANSS